MAMPLCGLIFFLEMTRPAKFAGDGSVAAQISIGGNGSAVGDAFARPHRSVARLKGISAELLQTSLPQPGVKIFSASDAERAFGGSAFATLRPGIEAEFVTKDHRRVALRVIDREPIGDQALPSTSNSRMIAATPTSTANLVSFVWGPWQYLVEVQDKGVEPEVVVQKVL